MTDIFFIFFFFFFFEEEARISSLGKTLSLFPLAPSYAKILVMAKQNDLLPYACCLVAALSVREPLIPVYSLKYTINILTFLFFQRLY